jgi:hypothetical protein
MTLQTTTSRVSLYLKAALFMILMLIAGFFLVIFFLVGIIEALLTGDYLLFVGGIIFLVLFLLVGTVARRFQPAWEKLEETMGLKPKTRRESITEVLPLFISLFVAIVFTFVFESYLLSFPQVISPSLAEEMLRSILTLDGILIGFCGVVLAQYLWAINSKGNVIYEQMMLHGEDAKKLERLNEEVKWLSRTKYFTIGMVFYSMMPLLASILICLNKLTLVEGNHPISPRLLLYDPIFGLVVGIMLLAFTTMQFSLLPKPIKPPTESSKQESSEKKVKKDGQ